MATKRDVRMTVGISTDGTDSVRKLADELAGVGDAAGASVADANALAAELVRLKTETEGLAAATKDKRTAEAAARAEVTATRAALAQQGDALARMRAESTAATRAEEAYQAAERASKLAIVETRAALRDKQAALAAAVSASKAAAAAEQQNVETLKATAAAYRAATSAATTGAREQQAAAGAVSQSLASIKGQLDTLRDLATVALGGSLVGSLAKDVADVADGFNNLQARIKLVTGDGPALAAALQGVVDVAQRTSASLETTGTLFARIVESGRAFNLAQSDALRLTESINQAVAISGTSAQASEAAITQLIQGLQSGVVRGEEFNSVMEQAPRLAQALADGLGVAKGELRKLAEQGTLTSATVIQALQGQSQALQREFDQLPPTVGRAIQNLSTAWSVYVGSVDKATGATSTAAGAINLIAGNLDALGAALYSAGKAALAYQAVNLARSFLTSASAAATSTAATATNTAATAAATVATVANTTARTANTAATLASAEASTAAAASAGRFSAILGALKPIALVTVLTNLQEIGTAIGEGAARMLGYGKRIEEVDRALKDQADAARAGATAAAALAQQQQQATDRALGLGDAARKLVGEFNGLVQKGETTADALAKVSKALQLGDISGIAAASAALDALGQRGQITGEQIRAALSSALKSEDLLIFETNARAAFDSSEQGARRLRAALDAISEESLRRVGTSAEELRTGFSAAMNSALNDTDTLKRSLDDLGVKGVEAGRLLATSLEKALQTAATERAVQTVIDRWEELGKAGKVTGDQLAAGLDKARAKLDELRPGINSLDEALRSFGLKTRDELTATATKLGESYRVVAGSVTTSLQDKVKAFNAYREAAIAANGGVETSEVDLQRRILEAQAAAAGLGDEFERAMSKADRSIDRTRDRVRVLSEQMDAAAGSLSSSFEAETKARGGTGTGTGTNKDAQGFVLDSSGQRQTSGTFLPQPSKDGPWQWIPKLNQGYQYGGYWQNDMGTQYTGMKTGPYGQNRSSFLGEPMSNLGTAGYEKGQNGPAPYLGANTLTAPGSTGSTGAGAGGSYTVNVNIGGKRSTVNVASRADADALTTLLKQLEDSEATS